jgi:hypothetical protein
MESSKKKSKMTVEDLGPENLPEDAQVGVTYIEYESLEAPEMSKIDGKTLAAMMEGEDWKQQYESLNVLRALNKYHREILLEGGDSEESLMAKVVAPFIANQVDNLRSNISKCALMLVKEIYLKGAEISGPDARMSHFSRVVLPVTLIKTVYEK